MTARSSRMPGRPRRAKFAYIKDSDTAAGYARNLRLLLEFVAENTDADEIHVIGYSNGTRLVLRAMEQLALIHEGESADEIWEQLRLRNVILVGSDLDRGVFGSYMADGNTQCLESTCRFTCRGTTRRWVSRSF